ncbi:endonuclease domain-containing protein [Novosphingobium album (ex Liu et al. 2023)]|uniref:DUF559 domain-containing protein n=1 Tax=Novosphingobium album (ex Liu et al. 2023) TaxID=3031130 RepID=A0ABT5WNW1_9SPHN|nr:DUF559 domain-containing protein [Novosphingobium album (ex Liu et al. 2023)]MDE8651728.1 DUF559 domain-containing protein [Novosphingobium album (ex Liu et al. 2023)]
MSRKTLSVKAEATPSPGGEKAWSVTGARLENLKAMAREKRRHPTEARALLWERLGSARFGAFKFRQQALVGSTLVDFACPSRWLVVEISEAGANPELDALQDRKLTDVGIRVLRFAEDAVLADADGVADAIEAELNKPFDRRAARSGAGRGAGRYEG